MTTFARLRDWLRYWWTMSRELDRIAAEHKAERAAMRARARRPYVRP